MTRLVLTRHGETVSHAENRYAGHTDIAMTDRGRTQAQELAAWAALQPFDAVWSSPLSRARLTAQPTAEALGLPLQIDDRLIEVDFGAAEGLTDREMRERFPSEREAFVRDPLANPLPSSEPIDAAAQRAETALRLIASRHPDGRVLVVAHNTLLRLVLCRLIGVSLAKYRVIFPRFDNCAITEIALAPTGEAALIAFNVPLPTSSIEHRSPHPHV